MDKGRYKDILEIIGVFSIVVSLGFVAFEVSQNTAAVRSSVIQSVSDQSIGAITLVVENAELRNNIDDAIKGTADEKQLRQVNAYYAMLLRVQKNRFLQIEIGAINKSLMIEMSGKATVYDTIAFRNYWEKIKFNQSHDFQSYMEEQVFSKKIISLDYTSN